ncbi:MAG: transglycosylase SLT domain-containing protein [Candidatus Tumulicola sp.]
MNIEPIATRMAAQGVAYAPEIAGAARRHGLDPELLAAVAAQETGGPDSNAGHNVLGDGGHGHGVFQIDDRWHAFAKTPAAMDPAQNADYAAGMLSGLLARYKGNVHQALSAYNAGSPEAAGTQTRWRDGRQLGYADSVLHHYTRLTGTSPEPAAASEAGTSPQDCAVAELRGLIASMGALASKAQGLPSLPTPAQPPQAPAGYHAQVTDYAGLLDNDANN